MPTNTTTPLPIGADHACPFEDEYGDPNPITGIRYVAGPECAVGGATAVACCFQRVDGTIVQEGNSTPTVGLDTRNGAELTPQEARQLARHLIAAADLVERWGEL